MNARYPLHPTRPERPIDFSFNRRREFLGETPSKSAQRQFVSEFDTRADSGTAFNNQRLGGSSDDHADGAEKITGHADAAQSRVDVCVGLAVLQGRWWVRVRYDKS